MKITPLKWCCPTVPILPTAYDSAYSYEEQLCILVGYVNKLAEELNKVNIDEINKTINDFEQYVNSALNSQNNKINEFILQYTNDINEILQSFQTIKEALNAENRTYADSKYYELLHKIEELKLCYTIYNPYKGYETSLDEWANDVAQLTAFNGITAEEYYNLNLTAEDYKELNLSAYDYSYRFKIVRNWLYKPYTNPFTGVWANGQEIFDKLASFHLGGYTAGEYDSFELSAQQYQDYELTAEAYSSVKWHEGG